MRGHRCTTKPQLRSLIAIPGPNRSEKTLQSNLLYAEI